MKHTEGKASVHSTGPVMTGYKQPYGIDISGSGKTIIIAGCFGDLEGEEKTALSNAFRLAQGWNLLNELDALGINAEQVPAIVEALKSATEVLESHGYKCKAQRQALGIKS